LRLIRSFSANPETSLASCAGFLVAGPVEEFLAEQFLGGEIELVLLSMDVGVGREGKFYDGLFLRAVAK